LDVGDSTGVIEAWTKAFIAGDLDGIMELYDDDAVFFMPSMEILAKGKDEIRAAWAGVIALGPVHSIDITERDEHIDGNTAYAHQSGVLKGEMGGEPVEIPFRTTEVMRRGADGSWRYVIDHA
jgi:ketosteroid isomerase-like protein